MKLQWSPEYEMGTVSSDDDRAQFQMHATRFANGVQCVGATFQTGTTYVALDRDLGCISMIVIPDGGPAPEEMLSNFVRYVRADLLREAFEKMVKDK